MQDRFIVALMGVACITSITIACIVSGIDGVVVGSSIGAISGIIAGIFGYLKGKSKN